MMFVNIFFGCICRCYNWFLIEICMLVEVCVYECKCGVNGFLMKFSLVEFVKLIEVVNGFVVVVSICYMDCFYWFIW